MSERQRRSVGVWIAGLVSGWLFLLGAVTLGGSPPEWLNTAADVEYIGSARCIECHREQHVSYLQTTHSVSVVETAADDEPPPTAFEHPASGSRYEVIHDGSLLIHRETRLDHRGIALATTEQPMFYTVGSGTHGKSYLFRDGEFWGQSPLTWYAESGQWEMSPGFDHAEHSSFQRKIATRCVFCHVGRIDRGEGNPYKFDIVEPAIGCERCHGPGELHARRHASGKLFSGPDRTIVNPATLPRDLAEGICQQCHLQGVSKVNTSGHQPWDFRPGLSLAEFRVDYQFGVGNDRMRIVGHVEQLHASPCYQQTESLTCTSCHDPHAPVPAAEKEAFYRQACLSCHQDQSCGTPHDERMRLADNSCYQCHMPKAPTNVTHAAFHNHRIGVYPDGDASLDVVTNQLVPVLDVSSLPERERARCEAIAKVVLYRDQLANPDYQSLATEAIQTLIGLKNSGEVDPLTDSTLAWLARRQGQLEICENLATEVLQREPKPRFARIEATSLLAEVAFNQSQRERAVELFRAVNEYHREARDLFFLGLSENNVGNVDRAIEALQRSLDVDPMQVGPHGALQAIYTAQQDPVKAAAHRELAERIRRTLEVLRARADEDAR